MAPVENKSNSTSVMQGLYHLGNYPEILETIFFMLDLRSLANFARTGAKWKSYINKEIFYIPRSSCTKMTNQLRLRLNWYLKKPIKVYFQAKPAQELGPLSPGLPCFVSLVADEKNLLCASLGCVEAFDASGKGQCQRIFQDVLKREIAIDISPEWYLHYYPEYLRDGVWFHSRFNPSLRFNVQTHRRYARQYHFLNSDLVLMVCPSELMGAKLDKQNGDLSITWRFQSKHEVYSLCPNGVIFASTQGDRITVKVVDRETGALKHSMSFSGGDYDIVKGIHYTAPVGILLLAESEEVMNDGWVSFRVKRTKIVLLDLALGMSIKELKINCSDYLGDISNSLLKLWCDPPVGTLVMALRRRRDLEPLKQNVLIWNFEKLLRDTKDGDTVSPDRVLRVEGNASAESIAINNSTLYQTSAERNQPSTMKIVKNIFWGKLLS